MKLSLAKYKLINSHLTCKAESDLTVQIFVHIKSPHALTQNENISYPWRRADGSYVMRCVSQGKASILQFGLALLPERFTASEVPGRSQGSVATVSMETCLSRAERRDKVSASSPDSPSGEYRDLTITPFFRKAA